jgi:hypothetical protein
VVSAKAIMRNFNIFITSHSLKYIDHYKEFKLKVEREFPEVCLHILISEESPPNVKDVPKHFHFLHPKNFHSYLNKRIDRNNVYLRLKYFSETIPMDLHQSELQGLLKTKTLDMLALEQAELSEKISKIFNKIPPHLVFVSSGTNIIHSIGYYLSVANNAKVYRIHNYLQLNLNYEGQRVWFCSNNKMTLSNLPEDKFDYEESDVENRIDSLHKALIDSVYNPDQLSKQFRVRRMPINFSEFLKDILKVIYWSLKNSKIDRLNKNKYLNRLQVLFNAWRNQSITIETKKLNKPYILFALNTPYDSQVLVRAPEYKDFLSLIELVANLVPYGHDLVLREHPAFLGMLDHSRLKKLQKRHSHIKLGSSDIAFPEILNKAKGILILNNTAFIDAILAKKPVIALSNGYFRGQRLCYEIENLRELRQAFKDLINDNLENDRRSQLRKVMIKHFKETYPGPSVCLQNKIEMISKGILEKLYKIQKVYGGLNEFKKQLPKGMGNEF